MSISTRSDLKTELAESKSELSDPIAQLKSLHPVEQDFTGEKFNWKRPIGHNQIPKLPIFIGEGMSPPFSSISYPVEDYDWKKIGEYALHFVENHLKRAQASYVVAIKPSYYWENASYIGEFNWDNEDREGFFKKFKDKKDIKYLSFVDQNGEIITLIAKRNADLFHWQIFKGSELYHEMHILKLDACDGYPVKLQDFKDERPQILHDILCEALEKNKSIYNHCAAGIGRSAIVTLAELMMIQQSSDLQKFAPEGLPDLKNPNYFQELLSWAHKNVRTGLLGRGNPLSINFPQVMDCLEAAAHLLKLHKNSENRKTIAERVQLTSEESHAVLELSKSLEEQNAKQKLADIQKAKEEKRLKEEKSKADQGDKADKADKLVVAGLFKSTVDSKKDQCLQSSDKQEEKQTFSRVM